MRDQDDKDLLPSLEALDVPERTITREIETLRRLDRWDRQLWIIASVVMVVLALALVSLYVSLPRLAARAEPTGRDYTPQFALGLLGLVGLLSAYLFAKRHQIRGLHLELFEEQAANRALAGRVHQLGQLVLAARALDLSGRPETVARKVARHAVRLVRAHQALVFVRSADGGVRLWQAHCRSGTDHAATRFLPEAFGNGPAPAPAIATGLEAVRRWLPDAGPEVASLVVSPLQAKGRTFGHVVAVRLAGETDEPFAEDHARLLWILAEFAAYALIIARAQRRLRRRNRELKTSMERLQAAHDRLIQVERLTAVGELVAGMAHELNNPLSSLVGYAQLLTALPEQDLAARRGCLEDIQREALRCTAIVQNLVTFASPAPRGREVQSLREVVESTLGLKSYDLRRARVSTSVDVPDGLPAPLMDRADLQQVLLNLINNALAALSGRERPTIRISAAEAGGDVCLRISDNGRGIPRLLQGQIFEPFFSTKKKKEGLGLGLHTCVTLVSECGGSITVQSEEERGTTMTLRLPAPEPVAA